MHSSQGQLILRSQKSLASAQITGLGLKIWSKLSVLLHSLCIVEHLLNKKDNKISFLLARPYPISAWSWPVLVGTSLILISLKLPMIIYLYFCIFRVQSDFTVQIICTSFYKSLILTSCSGSMKQTWKETIFISYCEIRFV